MIELFQIASEVTGTAVEAQSGGIVDAIATKFHIDAGKLISQLLAILVVFTILRVFAWNPVLKLLDERKQKIEDGLQYAEEMRTKLADAEKQQQETIRESALEAKRITEEAQKSAKETIESSMSEAQLKSEELVARTRESLELERKQMLTEVKEHVSRLVVTTAGKVLDKQMSDSEKAAYSEKAAEELASK